MVYGLSVFLVYVVNELFEGLVVDIFFSICIIKIISKLVNVYEKMELGFVVLMSDLFLMNKLVLMIFFKEIMVMCWIFNFFFNLGGWWFMLKFFL